MSDLLSLDDVDDDISEALAEDAKDVDEAEKVVEEQIEEDVERAHQEAEEEREAEAEDEEETEQDEKDLEDVQDSLEYFQFAGSDTVSRLIIKKTVERLAWRRGQPVPTAALEAFDKDDTQGLVEFVTEQRNRIEEDRTAVYAKRNHQRLDAWEAIDSAVSKFIGLIKSDQGNVASLSDTGTMALCWEELSDTNRKDFEMLVNQHGHWVDNVIDTLSSAKQSVRRMTDVINAELDHYALVQEDPAAAPGYGHFLSDLKEGGDCLFKEPLIGVFNMRINPVCVDDMDHPTYDTIPVSNPAEITVSTTVGGVDTDAVGDRRELEDLQEITLAILKISKIASKAFIRLYKSDMDEDAPCLSIHLVIRMVRILVALRRTLSLSEDKTDAE